MTFIFLVPAQAVLLTYTYISIAIPRRGCCACASRGCVVDDRTNTSFSLDARASEGLHSETTGRHALNDITR